MKNLFIDPKYLESKKILLIDDEEEILKILEIVLKKEGFYHIDKASLGKKGIQMCREVDYDLIILDIMLPDIDGFSVCQQLRNITLAPIFFLSAKEEDSDRLIGLSLGGDDYITKPFSPKEVAFKMKAFFRREQYHNQEEKSTDKGLYNFGDVVLDEKKGTVLKNNIPISLTAKEFHLLLYLIKNPNQVFSLPQLYRTVWNEECAGCENVIMVHIRHLRQKLEDNPSNPKYILNVRGLGYKMCIEGNVE